MLVFAALVSELLILLVVKKGCVFMHEKKKWKSARFALHAHSRYSSSAPCSAGLVTLNNEIERSCGLLKGKPRRFWRPHCNASLFGWTTQIAGQLQQARLLELSIRAINPRVRSQSLSEGREEIQRGRWLFLYFDSLSDRHRERRKKNSNMQSTEPQV